VNVTLVEVVRGKDGKRYPAGLPRPRAELNRLRWMVHGLVCRDGNSIRQAQAIMLQSYGARRSLGALHKDLVNFQCPDCEEQAPDPAPAPQAGPVPAAVHHLAPGGLTGMVGGG
jgi:hypothetical protein